MKPNTPFPADAVHLQSFIPWLTPKHTVKKEIISPATQETQPHTPQEISPLLRALALAHYWQYLLETGKISSISALAQAEDMHVAWVSKILKLALLPPKTVEEMAAGRIKQSITAFLRQKEV